MAQTYYVFYNATRGYLYNDNGTLKSVSHLKFDKSSVWVASGVLDNNNNRTINSYTDDSKFLYRDNSAVSLNSSSTGWRYDNGLYVRTGNGRSATNNFLTTSNGTTFSTTNSSTSVKFLAYEVTTEDVAAGLSNFSVSGGGSINATGDYTFTHTNANYAAAYTKYSFNNTTTYVNSSNGNSSSISQSTVSSGYTWSLSDNAAGYATIDASTGVLTVSSFPTSGNLTFNVICTVSYDGYTATASTPVTLTITGVSGGVVTIDDREDHRWSYYQAASDLPTGYPTTYLSSPDPRNVKITYRGGSVSGASAVAISALDGEGQDTMVYYKTLEKSVIGMTGDYPYTVISNPFSKRPRTTGSTGNNGFYGFAGWKVVDGGEYIQEYSDGSTLPLDATIHFTNLDDNYTSNCTSAEVIFEATWTEATVQTGSSNPSFTGGTYETNFWVLESNNNIGNITIPADVTVSARYPDGTVHFTRNLTGTITAGGNNAKLEFVNMNSTGDVSAANYTFTMGRGIVNSNNGGQLRFCTRDANCVNTVKIESGTYASLRNFTTGLNAARSCSQLAILGCDYDRASNDNSKLTVRGSMYVAGDSYRLNRESNSLYVRIYIKSGDFGSTIDIDNDYTGAGGTQSYYISVGNSNYQNAGRRYLCMEGGEIFGIAGGMDESNNQNTTARAFDLRVRGTAHVRGVVYGAAEYVDGRGTRCMIFTGGTINGWIAGGANGTRNDGGALNGTSYIYFGGSARLDSKGSTTAMNSASGGNLFGAGCGFANTAVAGQVQLGTNVVVSDGAYVERGVYGGGGFGYCSTDQTSNLFILGNCTIAGVKGNITNDGYSGTGQYSSQTNKRYNANIAGGVFGGACQNQGGTVNIYMNGGTIEQGGLYGGSNETGTLSGNVTIQIDGGQVGLGSGNKASQLANVHGGGLGKPTGVSGNVSVTLGQCNASSGATIYGDVYGGSALGSVNTSTSNTTTVTLLAGKIYGGLYGGGLGSSSAEAAVNGDVAVRVAGGSVLTTADDPEGVAGTGSVFGCNNVNGSPSGSVKVDIYNTDQPASGYALHAVYGGGNRSAYDGKPVVTIHGCDNMIKYVYGGGNATDVAGTNVTIYGGTIGYAFAGGNGAGATNPGANITASGTLMNIYGGTIGEAFGGSNEKGYIHNTITVNINKPMAETGKDICDRAYTACPMNVKNLYGGGNKAVIKDKDGKWLEQPSVSVDCDATVGNLFGGAKQANYGDAATQKNIELEISGGTYNNVFGGNDVSGEIFGNVTVTVRAGKIGNVFGGNDKGGDIKGKITVNIDSTDAGTCSTPFWVGNVYGGGYEAEYTPTTKGDYPEVNIINGTVQESVYGGGYGAGATVKSNPFVTFGGTAGTIDKNGTVRVLHNLYGGGNEADVEGNPHVMMLKGEVGTSTDSIPEHGCIFGAGRGVEGSVEKAKVTGNTHVELLGGTVYQNVYGGGHLGKVYGDTKVELLPSAE